MKQATGSSILATIIIVALALSACERDARAVLKAGHTDSILYAAGNTKNYDRVLALVDSLEQNGDISEVNSNRWRGVAYFYKGQLRTSEFYYKKAIEAPIRNEQDQLNYNKSARRLAVLLTDKGKYEDALRVAVPALAKIDNKEQGVVGSPADYATLLNTIGCCQLKLGRPKEAATSLERAYEVIQETVEDDTTGRQFYNAFKNTINVAKAYINVHQYEDALFWIDRSWDLLQRGKDLPQVEKDVVAMSYGQTNLYRAIALQGIGKTGEAANSYREAAKSLFGSTLEGRLAANEYLLSARFYREAADNNRDLDRLFDKTGMTPTLSNIQQYLLPKFRANVGAQRRDSAIAAGMRICDALDSAIARNKKDDAAELATIYGMHQKEAEIGRQRANLTRQQFIDTSLVFVLVIIFFTIYTLHKRKSTHRLSVAHTKLQEAYDQLEATTAAKERIESELRIARDIQMSMVPNVFPNRQGLDLYASMTPAKEVGGDLYGYLMMDDSLYFCIGDVSGKGVPASLFMAQATRLFRTLATQQMMPAEIATRMNNALTEDNEQGMFVTMFIGLVDLKTGHLDYCNAGHNPPVIIPNDSSQKPAFMDILANAPIGLWPGIDYENERLETIMGKTLFLYTDGLNEAEDRVKQQFGDDRLLDILSHTHVDGAQQVIETLANEVEKHRKGAEPNDDLTMLCLRIN